MNNDNEDAQRDDDLDYARGTYLELIENQKAVIAQMMELAESLESPRLYEVLSTSIKTTAEISDRLVELHKSKKSLLEKKEYNKDPALTGSTTNNNLFIGSTDELQKLLKNGNSGNNVEKEVSGSDS